MIVCVRDMQKKNVLVGSWGHSKFAARSYPKALSVEQGVTAARAGCDVSVMGCDYIGSLSIIH